MVVLADTLLNEEEFLIPNPQVSSRRGGSIPSMSASVSLLSTSSLKKENWL